MLGYLLAGARHGLSYRLGPTVVHGHPHTCQSQAWLFFCFFCFFQEKGYLWKGSQVKRREGTGQQESKAQPAQASTSTTETPNPVNPNRKRAHLGTKRT